MEALTVDDEDTRNESRFRRRNWTINVNEYSNTHLLKSDTPFHIQSCNILT